MSCYLGRLINRCSFVFIVAYLSSLSLGFGKVFVVVFRGIHSFGIILRNVKRNCEGI